MRPILIVALLCSLFILVGCGIKGPLYLPDIPQAPPGEPPAIPSQMDGDDSKPENLQPQ
ncbi:MAG TPA: lipoprotein [Azoarcus sp.]|nr:lipoprotein [Azoarcus sp.]